MPTDFLEGAREPWSAQAPSKLDVSEAEDAGTMNGYAVQRVVVTAGTPDDVSHAEIEMWISKELWDRLADTANWPLEKDRLSASPVTAFEARALGDLKAFPVKFRADFSYHGQHSAYVRTLISVSEEDVPASTYEVPAGFTPFPDPAH